MRSASFLAITSKKRRSATKLGDKVLQISQLTVSCATGKNAKISRLSSSKLQSLMVMKLKYFPTLILSALASYAPQAYSSDWWSGSQKQSLNSEMTYIGTDFYNGQGQLVLTCTRRGPKAEVILHKSKLSSGILFKMQVDKSKWIKNANNPKYNNAFETYMIHHLTAAMKKRSRNTPNH